MKTGTLHGIGHARWRLLYPYALLAPTLILLIVMIIYPLVYSLYISMTDWSFTRLGAKNFIGLANYVNLLTDPGFMKILGRTVLLSVLAVLLAELLGLLNAVILDRPSRLQGVARALILVPWAMPPAATGIMWLWILNGDYGVLNALLSTLGLIDEYRVWLGSPTSAFISVLLIKVWMEVPFVTLILLAGLQMQPAELHEAAQIDGAGPWKRFIHITLPILRQPVAVTLVLETMWALRIFDIPYILTRGGPADATMVIALETYFETFNYFALGRGAAMAYLITALILLVSIGYVRLIGRES